MWVKWFWSMGCDHSVCSNLKMINLALECVACACVYLRVCERNWIDKGMKGSPCDLGFIKEKLMSSPVWLSHFSSLPLFFLNCISPHPYPRLFILLILWLVLCFHACCLTHVSELYIVETGLKISSSLVTSHISVALFYFPCGLPLLSFLLHQRNLGFIAVCLCDFHANSGRSMKLILTTDLLPFLRFLLQVCPFMGVSVIKMWEFLCFRSSKNKVQMIFSWTLDVFKSSSSQNSLLYISDDNIFSGFLFAVKPMFT